MPAAATAGACYKEAIQVPNKCFGTDTSPLAADSLRDIDIGEMLAMLSVER